MTRTRTIPSKDADFNVWQHIVVTEAMAKSQVWLLDQTWVKDILTPARTKWNTAWTAYENPATRTPVIIAAKTDARAEYEKVIMTLVANIRVNTRITNDDRRAMGIHIRDTKPTPVPTPTTYPVLAIDTAMSRRLTIAFRDSEASTIAKPKGIHGAEIKWLVADEKPTVGQLTNSTFDTRTPYTLVFDDEQRGKTVWICARWENTRGEKGPWGDMESAIVT